MQKKAIISTYNKQGITQFGNQLISLGYEIIATQGTGRCLQDNNILYLPASEVTRNPPGLTDCIQTISYWIPAGILFNRSNPKHLEEVKDAGIVPIDIVIYNFPPLHENVKDVTEFDIQHVDVGGPLMVRAAATNFRDVVVVVDPADYENVSKLLVNNMMTLAERRKLAIKAFEYTRNYDQEIIKFLNHIAL